MNVSNPINEHINSGVRPWVIVTSKSLISCSVKVSQSVSVPAHIDWSESEDFINHMDIMVGNNMGQSVMADISKKVKFILKTGFFCLYWDFYELLKNMGYF